MAKTIPTSLILMMAVPTAFNALAAKLTPSEKSWQHSFEIYALALNIRGDSAIGNLSTEVDVDPGFIT